MGLLALGLCVALGLYDDLLGTLRGGTALLSVGGVTVAGVLAAVLRQRGEAELASVRSIAAVAQRVLLRPVPRGAGQLRVAVSYASAMAEARIGGDLYEVVTSPSGVRVIVGDVQGKGLEAVETAAVVLGAFREAAYDEPDLVGVGERIERALARHLSGEEFVTAVLAEVGDRPRVTLLNYGHPRRSGCGRTARWCTGARPGGRCRSARRARRRAARPYEVPFGRGDQLLFYTDGVSEARGPGGHFYPLDDRAALLKEPDPESALAAVRQDLMEHVAGPSQDDAAMLLLRHRDW
ncbi:SpoIIE family protein phosphatase [Streptomyces sp. M19]